METRMVNVLRAVAEELGVSEDDLLQRGLRSILERSARGKRRDPRYPRSVRDLGCC
jgi:hypothetical protein